MARTLTNLQKQSFIKLLNKSGYVLDFSNRTFGEFCWNSIECDPQAIYGASKGASLESFIREGEPEKVIRLLKDLIEYYPMADIRDDIRKADEKLYEHCKGIIDSYDSTYFTNVGGFTEKVNSAYIEQMQQEMLQKQKENPTEAIGKAKELIESCCKTILDELGEEYSNTDKLTKLVDKVVDKLSLSPDNIKDSQKAASTIKQILGNLRAIGTGIAELRNPYGSGHGKSATYKGLQERHAKLAVGSSLTLVNFLWDSFELQKDSLKKDK